MSANLTQEQLIATITAQVIAALDLSTSTPAPEKAAAVKAEPRYRTEKQIATGRAKYDALWAQLREANPGVSGKDLAKAHKAELAACWPKGTRKTPAK